MPKDDPDSFRGRLFFIGKFMLAIFMMAYKAKFIVNGSMVYGRNSSKLALQ